MFIFFFMAAFLAVSLLGWIIFALTHPVVAGQGVLIFLCKAAGFIALLVSLGLWISQGFLQALPGFVFMGVCFFASNKLELRWRSSW